MKDTQTQPAKFTGPRPTLTPENVASFLDWTLNNLEALGQVRVEKYMQAAELVIRTRATDAQAKATQHTLVEQGIIDQPGQ